jgi:hypothetical protein
LRSCVVELPSATNIASGEVAREERVVGDGAQVRDSVEQVARVGEEAVVVGLGLTGRRR